MGVMRGNCPPFAKGDPRINRKGRPPVGESLAEIVRRIGVEKVSAGEDKMTRIEGLCRIVYGRALKGDIPAAKLIFERGWGAPVQPIENVGSKPFITFTIDDPKPTHEKCT
jgi:hypothetical protein